MKYISAGMPCSGSTLLFNILRTILGEKHPGLISGWEGDVDVSEALLIKTHNLFRYRSSGALSFATYRDVRIASLSCYRKWGNPASFSREAIKRSVHEYKVCRRYADHFVKYEMLVENPYSFICMFQAALRAPGNPRGVYDRVIALKPPEESGYSKETLLHHNHFTGATLEGWRKEAPIDIQEWVESEYNWFFEECGYEHKL